MILRMLLPSALCAATSASAATGQLNCVLDQACDWATEVCTGIAPLPTLHLLHGNEGWLKNSGPLALAALPVLENQISQDVAQYGAVVDLPPNLASGTRAYLPASADRLGDGVFGIIFQGQSNDVSTWWSLELTETDPDLPVVIFVYDKSKANVGTSVFRGNCTEHKQ